MTPEDRANELKRLEAKLQPWRIRSTLAFAGLFQLTHELIKANVLDAVKGFFGHTALGPKEWWLGDGKDEYQRHVLDRAPGKAFDASLMWLVEMRAVTSAQAKRLDDVYSHRHDLAHELAKYLVDPDAKPDVQLFVEALEILRALARFWVEYEVDIGLLEDHPDATIDDVTPLQLMVLQMCIDAYVEGLSTDGTGEAD